MVLLSPVLCRFGVGAVVVCDGRVMDVVVGVVYGGVSGGDCLVGVVMVRAMRA